MKMYLATFKGQSFHQIGETRAQQVIVQANSIYDVEERLKKRYDFITGLCITDCEACGIDLIDFNDHVIHEDGKYWLHRPGDLFDGVRLTDCCKTMDKGTEMGIVCRSCWRSIEGTGECYEYRTPDHERRHREMVAANHQECIGRSA